MIYTLGECRHQLQQYDNTHSPINGPEGWMALFHFSTPEQLFRPCIAGLIHLHLFQEDSYRADFIYHRLLGLTQTLGGVQ